MLPGRGPRHQAADVGAVATDPLDLEGVRADVQAVDGHGAADGGTEAGEYAHGRGLARAVAPQQGGGLPGVRLHVDAAYGLHLAEADVEAADVDHGLAHQQNSASRGPIGLLFGQLDR